MDYLSARTKKVTILAYVTQHSLLAEYIVAKKCLEIMDETTTRLAFEFEGILRNLIIDYLLLTNYVLRIRRQYHKTENGIRTGE